MSAADKYLAFAGELADAAAQHSLPAFRSHAVVDSKEPDRFDPVTQADRAAEKAMRELIEQHYPAHGILGEEYGTKPIADAGDNLQWVLDPIDGTRAFITGLPIWATLIGLLQNGKPFIGLFDQPFTGERVTGGLGLPVVWQRGGESVRLATRACDALQNAVLATTSPDFFTDAAGEQEMADACHTARMIRYGGDGYNYVMLAAGQIDAVIEQGLQAYDIQPLIPIIEGAGGIVTDWHGHELTAGGQVMACGDKRLHALLLDRFKTAAQPQ